MPAGRLLPEPLQGPLAGDHHRPRPRGRSKGGPHRTRPASREEVERAGAASGPDIPAPGRGPTASEHQVLQGSSRPLQQLSLFQGRCLRFPGRDDGGRTILARRSGRYIVLLLGENNPETAETLLTRVEKRLTAQKEER